MRPNFRQIGNNAFHKRCAFREEGFDTVEEILDYIEDTFPLPSLLPNSPLAEAATEDFFSKFCFYIKVNLMWDVDCGA
jgi:hypothetical protein